MAEKNPIKKAVVNADTLAHLANEPFESAKTTPSIEASVQDTRAVDEINAELKTFIKKNN
ncbi:hypothetical protein H9L19_03580 [Weissella diestrammenae]|uniref:Uncharacterized protein n=1 Tax=Weissella diestrammenae TaxID=1162633 RepID=A0A7G9T773_9LACO|nr:hypothetical protein [Weissella diestrammenae]MCM0582450.1 hypothetical protein [Weissella diestrammenae]QNN75948.1 hypothetical protein H9L19_03580 [Weissella diestrammenae]